MTEDQKEEFNHIAYSYRSWPGADQAGVVARYDELVAYVESLMSKNHFEKDTEAGLLLKLS